MSISNHCPLFGSFLGGHDDLFVILQRPLDNLSYRLLVDGRYGGHCGTSPSPGN